MIHERLGATMKALRKDFYIQIKRTLNRFISIMLIVALGTAFYVGIRSTEPNMRLSADRDYDNGIMHDIRIVSTLGLTGDDVKAVLETNKIKEAIGAYNVDSIAMHGSEELTVRFMSNSDKINVPKIHSGENAMDDNECMVDAQLASKHNLKIGDKITVDNESVRQKEFTITGTFSVASYLSLSRGSTTVGTGTLDGLIIVPETAFDLECYTDIYALVEGTMDMNTYDKEYEDLLDEVTADIEDNLAEVRAKARYNEVVGEANEELSSARAEYESGKFEYESGVAECESGEKELAEKESELESAKVEIERNEVELESASKEYDKGVAEIESASKEHESGSKELESAKAEMKKSEKQYNKGVAEFESGKAEYESGKALFDTGKAEYESGLAEYESGKAQYEQGKAQYDAAVLLYGEEALKDTKLTLDQNYIVLSATKEQLDTAKVELDKNEKELSKAKLKIDKSEKELKKAGKQITKGKKEIKKNEKKLNKAKKQITSGKKELKKVKKELESGRSEIVKAKQDITEGQKEIKKAKKKLKKSKKELEDAKVDLTEAEKELADAEREIDDIEMPEWFVMDRNYIQTYVEYDANAARIGKIGTVFPIIFFIVAAMVSLTTMTRMVEEERTQIGTLKALGYGKLQIAFKYVAYGALATLVGGIIGGYVGGKLLPYVIIVAYRIMFVNQFSTLLPTNIEHFTVALLAAFVSVVGATLLACINELRAVPAELMRPEAPKGGKRVLLERVPFIWKRLSFNMKSTFRNLFRFKKRLVMTLFGIGACTALLLVGFGVRNSVQSMLTLEYGVVNLYDMTISYDTDEIAADEAKKAREIYKADDNIKEYTEVMLFTADVENKKEIVNANIVVPNNVEELDMFISLHNRVDGKEHSLTDNGVIITEKMSTLLGVKVGDVINIKEGDTEKYQVKVMAISENYTNHYLYMTRNLYESLYGQDYQISTAYLNIDAKTDTKKLSKKLMECEEISGISITEEVKENFAKSLKGMDAIIVVLIVAAGGLAFVVLYNLNNINIAERKRELATLKVLGFYDGEVSSYVYRENVIITLMGIALGIAFGVWLHEFVIMTAEVESMMFGRKIGTAGYVLSVIMTIIFAALINMTMHFKLKKVDMATSLKSVE